MNPPSGSRASSPTTAISKVNPETNSLLYRGYPVQELAATQPAEAVAYLLWNGELPTAEQLAALRRPSGSTAPRRRRQGRDRPDAARRAPDGRGAHGGQRPRRARSRRHGSVLDATGREENLARSIRLFAALPAIVAYGQRRRRGEELIAPRDDLDYAANFLWMTFGEEFDDVVVDAFNRSMILYAEHSFNASTFTARVITSTLSDLYSAVVGAIGALKGRCTAGRTRPCCTSSTRSATPTTSCPGSTTPSPTSARSWASGTASTSAATRACRP
jgi:citrate synthase